jgi:peptidoglycan hydrolase FlgJ
MKVSPADKIQDIQQAQNQKGPEALRRAAMQFEAILLMQLTSALNSTSEGDEESLFGSDGGSGLAKQMFSEQMAMTMSQSGGVGLSDIILKQIGEAETKPVSGGIKSLLNVVSAVKELKENATAKTSGFPLINRSAKPEPITRDEFSGKPEEARIIATFKDDLRNGGIDDSLKNLVLGGKVVNSTPERIVPNSQVMEVKGLTSEVASSPLKVSLQMPVSGRISSEFGNRFHPIDRKNKFHAGIDIAVARGTSVGAAAEGAVTFAGWKDGYGNLVIVKHPDGRETRYGHLASLSVSEGDEVVRGQQIALSGSTGKSTGPHLHFEVRENGQVVNPLRIVSNVFLNNAER